MAKKSFSIPTGKMPPMPMAPINATRIPIGRLKAPDATGKRTTPLMKRPLIPNEPPVDVPPFHRNKKNMGGGNAAY